MSNNVAHSGNQSHTYWKQTCRRYGYILDVNYRCWMLVPHILETLKAKTHTAWQATTAQARFHMRAARSRAEATAV